MIDIRILIKSAPFLQGQPAYHQEGRSPSDLSYYNKSQKFLFPGTHFSK